MRVGQNSPINKEVSPGKTKPTKAAASRNAKRIRRIKSGISRLFATSQSATE
jgi:hypothetical protein